MMKSGLSSLGLVVMLCACSGGAGSSDQPTTPPVEPVPLDAPTIDPTEVDEPVVDEPVVDGPEEPILSENEQLLALDAEAESIGNEIAILETDIGVGNLPVGGFVDYDGVAFVLIGRGTFNSEGVDPATLFSVAVGNMNVGVDFASGGLVGSASNFIEITSPTGAFSEGELIGDLVAAGAVDGELAIGGDGRIPDSNMLDATIAGELVFANGSRLVLGEDESLGVASFFGETQAAVRVETVTPIAISTEEDGYVVFSGRGID